MEINFKDILTYFPNEESPVKREINLFLDEGDEFFDLEISVSTADKEASALILLDSKKIDGFIDALILLRKRQKAEILQAQKEDKEYKEEMKKKGIRID